MSTASDPLLKNRSKSQSLVPTRSNMPKQRDVENAKKKRVLVVGAGAAGELKLSRISIANVHTM